ncbi:MAG TPA: SH3 domain-containing protein [Anaerolineae bacterium]|nr:SH3 domain-containing protein [Anaerolineae bacterium]
MGIPLYQNDPRWANTKIGLQDSLTISQVGCLLTSLTMVINHFGGDETPVSINNHLKTVHNGFYGAWINPVATINAYNHLNIERQKSENLNGQPAPLKLLDNALSAGALVLVRLDWSPSPDIQDHWVVLHNKQGDDYDMWDPWYLDSAASTLVGRYGRADNNSDPAQIILEYIIHNHQRVTTTTHEPTTKPTTTPKPAPTQPVPVPTTDEQLLIHSTVQLRVRQAPTTNSPIIRDLMPAEMVTVIEDEPTASAKIGQNDQWLHIQDANGQQGYVAAWLVTTADQPATTNETSPPEPEKAVATKQAKQKSSKNKKTTISTKLNKKTKTAPTATTKASPTVQTRLRQGPSTHDPIITDIMPSATVTLVNPTDAPQLGQQDAWVEVETDDGQRGYMAAWLLAPA